MSGSSGTPNLGSKINVISKAQIHYKGVLYTIDWDNATVALAKQGRHRYSSEAAVQTQQPVNDGEQKTPEEALREQMKRNRSRGQSCPTNIKENTIKFEGDFDFERANAQFSREELDKEFKKKLTFQDDKAEKGEGKDLDVVTQSEEATAEENHLGPRCYYNTSKSLFDNISSEPKTSSRWMMCAEERKLNTETFRVSGRFLRSRSFWGGFRGGRGNGATHRNPTSHRAGTGRV
ncbi:hypothetical protein MG293_019368 [Ovis ammon polii]|uniref:LSM family member 14B n=1 Tax=Ovis ammon polii TaxID=230172 RepID=A0AAD4TQK7_OVIAM|nr:hypothetical protein MG293_019368 [Ovis ammon polii]